MTWNKFYGITGAIILLKKFKNQKNKVKKSEIAWIRSGQLDRSKESIIVRTLDHRIKIYR